jgi:hypothetical protein
VGSVRLWLALFLALVAGGWLRPEPSAALEPFELSWSAPAECPSGADVSAALARLAAAGSRVEAARVEIVPVAGRWRATLSTRGAQRRLEGESCAAVVQALTVVLALAADQAELEAASAPQAAAPPEREPPEPSPAPSASAPERSAADGPRASPPEPAALGWGLRMGILAEVGLLPGPSLGPQAALGVSLRDWSLELGAAFLLPRHAELEGPASPRSDIDWLAGQLALHHALGRSLSVGLGAELGRLAGTGSGVDEPFDARGWWLAGSAGVRLHGALTEAAPLSWQLGLSVAGALERPVFGFDELGVLHRPSAVSGRLFLGLGWGR